MEDQNVIAQTGNLTRDPELRPTKSGGSVCRLRVAVTSRRKDEQGEWVDKPNYFDVTVFGARADAAAKYLSKGRRVAYSGRLEHREWEAEDGSKRQGVEIIADNLLYMGGNQKDKPAPSTSTTGRFEPVTEVEEPATEPVPAGGGASGEEDIPF